MPIASAWRQLPPASRRWLVAKALVATVAINTVVNATIAWLSVGVLWQTVFAVLLGIVVTPLIALCAMADPEPPGTGRQGPLRHDLRS